MIRPQLISQNRKIAKRINCKKNNSKLHMQLVIIRKINTSFVVQDIDPNPFDIDRFKLQLI